MARGEVTNDEWTTCNHDHLITLSAHAAHCAALWSTLVSRRRRYKRRRGEHTCTEWRTEASAGRAPPDGAAAACVRAPKSSRY